MSGTVRGATDATKAREARPYVCATLFFLAVTHWALARALRARARPFRAGGISCHLCCCACCLLPASLLPAWLPTRYPLAVCYMLLFCLLPAAATAYLAGSPVACCCLLPARLPAACQLSILAACLPPACCLPACCLLSCLLRRLASECSWGPLGRL